MPTQKTWGYDEAKANFANTSRHQASLKQMNSLLTPGGMTDASGGINPIFDQSWGDILKSNAYQLYGPSANSMSPQELEQIARTRGILGGKEQSFGEDLKEGFDIAAPFGLAMLGSNYLSGSGFGADAALAGGGEVGSGYAASAPGWGGGTVSAAGGAGGFGGEAGSLAGGGEVGSGYTASAPGATGGGMFDFSFKDLKDFAPVIGGILGGFSSSKPAGVTTTTEDLPEWLKPYASMGMLGLADAYKDNPTGESALTTAGSDYMTDVIGGDYLNNNPYLDDVYNKAAGKVTAGVNANFSKAGRYGSGAHQGVLAENLGNLATDIYAGNYNQERTRQQQAGLMAPETGASILNQRFLPAQNVLSGVGRIKGGTTSTPYFENQMASILSGALGAKKLFA